MLKAILFVLGAWLIPALGFALDAPSGSSADKAYQEGIQQWRRDVEASLRKDNGWLTLAGRYVLKTGRSSLGCGAGFDIKLPANTCPKDSDALGFVYVDALSAAPSVSLVSNAAQPWYKDGEAVSTRLMSTNADKRDWVSLGRLAMHFIERDGKIVLRLADNQSELRKNFAGRAWFDIKESYRLQARYVPSKEGNKIAIIDVLGDVHDESSPGYLEFQLAEKTYRLDVVADEGDDELFVIMKDGTSGEQTYPAARFMAVPAPKDLHSAATLELDFNKAYNPPCAFSAYTTCPLPPEQNQLSVRIEAGEQYRAAK